jgi:hypothetical protein
MGVRPKDVVDALEWRLPAEGAVWAAAIVVVEEWRERGGAFLFAGVAPL